MADPGEGPGLPLFLAQTEARLAEKVFFGDRPRLSKGLDDPPPPRLSHGLDPALYPMCNAPLMCE